MVEFADESLLDDHVTPLEPLDRELVRQQSLTSLLECQQSQELPPPLKHPCEHYSCTVSALRGLRNGLYFGGKVRFAHSLVMSVLFRKKMTYMQSLKLAFLRSWQHGRNLGAFVLVYKLTYCLLVQNFRKKSPAYAFIAGMVAALLIWRDPTNVNKQLCFYLLSRLLESVLV